MPPMDPTKNKNNSSREVRFLSESLEIRSADNSPGTIAGYAAVYESETDLGYFREVLKRGAFRKSLAEGRDVRALWNHDSSIVLGRTSAGTLRLEEDDKGLKFEIDLPDTQAGRDAATSIGRRDVTGMSFGFEVVTAKWVEEQEKDTELREIYDLRLWEISPVTFPAYQDTDVAKRGLDELMAQKAKQNQKQALKIRHLRHLQKEQDRRFKQ
jgi:HK97 family phage prohead protease